jgi:hypothetical protein
VLGKKDGGKGKGRGRRVGIHEDGEETTYSDDDAVADARREDFDPIVGHCVR